LALPLISCSALRICLPLFNHTNCLYGTNKDVFNWQVTGGIDVFNGWYKGNDGEVGVGDLRIGEGMGIFSS